ncbi:MAG TPA: DUF1735 domain-containing protein [Ginsengibacter sp.]|nr:DUF1735 domain-containing protein [Chitinophagaceae bacterium]HRN71841.1 DUF1735 domain-containing protein [Ginsengibacter sp.]HRP16378.1 DUF1735 domain-containing protein [Ginsengibacter sp.]HRP43675.1 DUF1735 domain-containing protein [Ginsengibacter sp.]
MKKVINLITVFIFLVGFSSCLKDDMIVGPDVPGAVKAVVEFKNPAPLGSSTSASVPVYMFASDRVATSEIDVEVNYTGVGGAPNDIAVKIKVDPAVANTALTEQGVDYDVASSSIYQISTTDLVIPKGKHSASFKVTYFPDQFTRVFAALGLSIETVTGTNAPISGNFGKICLFLGTKNQWDGKYTYNAVTSLGNATNETASMKTVGDYSVTMNLVNYYSNQVVFTVDPSDNSVDVSMTTLLPIATDPSSNWDPATKTFTMKWSSNAGARTYNETYVKQ